MGEDADGAGGFGFAMVEVPSVVVEIKVIAALSYGF